MMSLFEGLVEYYRVTGDEQIRQAVMNRFRNIRTKEITLISNGGGDQPYHPAVMGEAWDNTAFEQTNPDIKRMMETCIGVIWMKLCSQLLRLTGDPATADEIEKYVYNGLTGAMKLDGKGYMTVLTPAKCKAPHGSNRAGDHYQALVRGPIVLARDENMDRNYNEPVTLLSKDGYIDLVAEKPALESTRMQFKVPTNKGFIRMVDYASVNNWDGTHICTWCPVNELDIK
jgi:hypothetical protein